MYSLLLIYCLMTFGSGVSSSEQLFEIHNKCGCFSYEKCPKLHTPNCSIPEDNYQELYQQNSISSKSPEKCKWFMEGFKYQLKVSENGELEISLLFSSNLYQEITLMVQLRYQDQCSDIGNNSLFYLMDQNHSTKYVTVPGSFTDCKKAIKLSFPYIFSGCYQLYINRAENLPISGGCMSRPFFLTSSYKKKTLHNILVRHIPSYVGQSENLKFRYIGEGLNEPKSILISLNNNDCKEERFIVVKEAHLTSELVFTSVFGNFSDGLKPFSTAVTLKSDIDLSLEDCAGSGNRAGKYFLIGRGECCHGLEHPTDSETLNMTYCPCKWENDVTLECSFRDVKNGNYCVVIQFIDPRCDTSSLWTEIDCAWSFNIEAKGQITPTEIEPYKVNNLYPMVILYCVFVILVTAAVIFMINYFKKEKAKAHSFAVENIVEKSLFISEDEEILLLYPRDCDKFMTAMALFRMLLKESCGSKVHDAWDEEIYDKVAESIETWSLPLIQNKNTKIIVILTECSKVIEDSYIGDNQFAIYREPKAFDKVFAQSIKALNEYFATRFDSYRRVFVVRLDETPVIDFSFNFNRATVYILPHGLQTLVNDLQNGTSTPINKESNLRLKVAIHEYQVYKQQYINYLNDILNINNNCKIMKSLKNGIIR